MNESSSIEANLSSTAKKETAALRAFSFSMFSTQALVVSFIPLYFLSKGFTESQIGIIYSSGLFMSIFANIIMGIASDKFRTIRKLFFVLLFGQLAMVAFMYSLNEFIVICVIMAIFYFFQTPMNPLSDSLYLMSSKHTGTPYALIRIFGSLGFAISSYGFGLLLKAIGSQHTLLVAMCTISITLVFAYFIKDYHGAAKKVEYSGFFKLMKQRNIVLFFMLILICSTAHRMYESFLAVTLRHAGASDSLIGLSLLISATSEIPILFLLGKYGHKLKELPLLMLAALMYALRLWLLGAVNDPRLLVATQAMHSITFGIFFSTSLRYISMLIPNEFRASGQALYTVIWTGAAGLISGLLGGYIYEQFGRAAFYHTAAGIAIAAALGFLLYFLRRWDRLE
ncbi:MFS transporter [Paenibacillus sp. HB172176]|uniref:MFS transporter n=1 Tax=Paenibacillus sp. HB172176 TaxID=2493690 RepID=UPI0014394AB4|nr:MFS transporter [Paenibacillus sp. HB172176]